MKIEIKSTCAHFLSLYNVFELFINLNPNQKDPKKVMEQERDVANWEKLAAELTHKVKTKTSPQKL